MTSSATRPAGGAELAFVALLRRLGAEHGFRAVLCGAGARRWSGTVHGVKAVTVRDDEDLRVLVRQMRPDVIMSTQLAPERCQRLASWLGIPHVVYCQSFEYCPPTSAERRAWQVSLDRDYPSSNARRLVGQADLVVANSRYLQQRLERFGIRSCVIVPEFEPDDVPSTPKRARGASMVTGICGHPHKGSGIFLELAARLPDLSFLLAGHLAMSVEARASALRNVQHLPFGPAARFLARSRVVLVPSQWPEPFGRIAVEAMARAIPLLASRTGGLGEVIGDDPRLAVSAYRDVDVWERRLRELLADPDEQRRNAAAGVRRAPRFLRGRSAADIAARLRRLLGGAARRSSRTRTIALAGEAKRLTAFAMINRAWADAAATRAHDSTVVVRAVGAHDVPADVTVHHDLSQRFLEMPAPPEGHLVAVRTWDFGPFPKAWVERLASQYDELWVHTRWVRRLAIRGGVPPHRVRVVPLGVDPALFHPGGPQYPLRTRKGFRFLFVGAPVARKGVDVLLDAYLAAFTAADDVCLVLKTNPADVFYVGVDLRAQIAEAMSRPGAPQIELIDAFLTPRQLASLYRACSVGVFPYRAEGFAMPILESMASGCPVIVPGFGACLDYCTTASSWLLPVRRIRVPVFRRMAINSLGFEEDIDEVDFCEVERPVLSAMLAGVAAAPLAERQAMAARAVDVGRRFSWLNSLDSALQAADALDRQGVPVRVRAARHRLRRDEARRDAARELLTAALATVR